MNFQNPREFRILDHGLRNLFQLHKTLFSDFHPDVGPEGLNKTHWRALIRISESESECMKGIGRYVGLEAGSFTPVADRLIEEGLVERIPDPADRRRIQLQITAEGRKLVKEMKVMMKDHFSRKLSVLEKNQLEQLTEALATISDINKILQGHNK